MYATITFFEPRPYAAHARLTLMPAAPSGSCATGVDCGMQSNRCHCSALKVPPEIGLGSPGAKSGSLGPLIDGVHLAACAPVGSSSASTSAATIDNARGDPAREVTGRRRRGAPSGVRGELGELARRHRAREEEALRELAAKRREDRRLVLGLDALGNHVHAERTAHRDDGGDDRRVLGALAQTLHER